MPVSAKERHSMARPNLIKVNTPSGFIVRAKEVPMPTSDDPADVACPYCIPQATVMRGVADIIQYGLFGDDLHTTIFECKKCHHQVAVIYEVKYSNESI